MKIKKAFTLAESMIAMIVLGILGACALSVLRPLDIKTDGLKKSGKNTLIELNYATTQILANHSSNARMTGLLSDTKEEFSITDTGADVKLAKLYSKTLIISKKNDIPSTYTASALQNEQGEKIGNGSELKVSDFTQGFKIKNHAYIAFKLHSSCDNQEEYIYDPAAIDKRTVKNSCGLIFFDVNAQDSPNILGIDQYIVAIGRQGIK